MVPYVLSVRTIRWADADIPIPGSTVHTTAYCLYQANHHDVQSLWKQRDVQ